MERVREGVKDLIIREFPIWKERGSGERQIGAGG
jgi:hypothetical protein